MTSKRKAQISEINKDMFTDEEITETWTYLDVGDAILVCTESGPVPDNESLRKEKWTTSQDAKTTFREADHWQGKPYTEPPTPIPGRERTGLRLM